MRTTVRDLSREASVRDIALSRATTPVVMRVGCRVSCVPDCDQELLVRVSPTPAGSAPPRATRLAGALRLSHSTSRSRWALRSGAASS